MKKSKFQRLFRIYWQHFVKLCFGSYMIHSQKRTKNKDFVEKNGPMVITLVSLLLFLTVILIIYYGKFNGKDAGTIGDAFNGMTGPFIALLSAILVYQSFVAQTKANQKQTEAT